MLSHFLVMPEKIHHLCACNASSLCPSAEPLRCHSLYPLEERLHSARPLWIVTLPAQGANDGNLTSLSKSQHTRVFVPTRGESNGAIWSSSFRIALKQKHTHLKTYKTLYLKMCLLFWMAVIFLRVTKSTFGGWREGDDERYKFSSQQILVCVLFGLWFCLILTQINFVGLSFAFACCIGLGTKRFLLGFRRRQCSGLSSILFNPSWKNESYPLHSNVALMGLYQHSYVWWEPHISSVWHHQQSLFFGSPSLPWTSVVPTWLQKFYFHLSSTSTSLDLVEMCGIRSGHRHHCSGICNIQCPVNENQLEKWSQCNQGLEVIT